MTDTISVNQESDSDDEAPISRSWCPSIFSIPVFHRAAGKRRELENKTDVEKDNHSKETEPGQWQDINSIINDLVKRRKKEKEQMQKLKDAGHFDQALPKGLLCQAYDEVLQKARALQSRMKTIIYDTGPSGLKWMRTLTKPAGREMRNTKLEAALASKTEFTQQEFSAFGISELRYDDYIKSNDSYFKPASGLARHEGEAEVCTEASLEFNIQITEVHEQFLKLTKEYEDLIKGKKKGSKAHSKQSFIVARGGASHAGDMSCGMTHTEGSQAAHDEQEDEYIPPKKARNPEQVYKDDLRVGKEGLAWEARNGKVRCIVRSNLCQNVKLVHICGMHTFYQSSGAQACV